MMKMQQVEALHTFIGKMKEIDANIQNYMEEQNALSGGLDWEDTTDSQGAPARLHRMRQDWQMYRQETIALLETMEPSGSCTCPVKKNPALEK